MTLPLLPWRSRFVTAAPTDWTLDIPARPFIPRRPTVGGSRTAASGVPAGYMVRADVLFDLPIRFRESERAALYALLAWSEIGEVVTWYPDAADSGLSFEVYIETPKAGDELQPFRHATYGRIYETTLTLRFVSAAPELEYYAYNQ